jgi:hypothetical protein
MSEVRAMMGQHHTQLQESLVESIKQEDAAEFPVGPDGIKVYNILAISGGGSNGAYGAGLLKGWSREGSRPVFKIVTGVSTGAIIAPFAFMGKDYDDDLEKHYTTMSTKDVMSPKGFMGPLFGNSFASNAPLAKKIARMATDENLARIAAEHKKGRRLFVGTAELDSMRFVVWDMGAIAERGDKKLFRKIILASAAIPMVFPPSVFDVMADGKKYDELHVDGGTLTQVFGVYKLLEGMQDAAAKLNIDPSKLRAKLYIIRNGYMSPRYKKVSNELQSLAERSFDMIIDAQGVGDTYRLFVYSKKRGTDFNLAFIPPDYDGQPKEMFDPVEMRQLFDRGYKDAVTGYKWHKMPPGLENEMVQDAGK